MLKIFTLLLLTSCTYSINQIHTKGTASDVVDENQSATPDISPTISIPLAGAQGVPPKQEPRGLNGPMQPA